MTELDIEIISADIDQVFKANPVIQLQAKCVALIRMLEERDKRIAELEAQITVSPNGVRVDIAS